MKKNSKMALAGAAVVGGSVAARADVAGLQTAAETAIGTAETAVGAILVAGLVITIALWSYSKIKSAIQRN
jgi:hypothetical protein